MIVIYTSDNGFYNKMLMYEESLHLPLLIRLPSNVGSVKAGTVNHEMVSQYVLRLTVS